MGGRFAPALVAGVALAARVGHLLAFRELAFYRLQFGDSLSFLEEARRILAEGIFSGDLPYFQGPLYPLLLASIQAIGLPYQAAYWFQCAGGVGTSLLIYGTAKFLAGPRAGLFAGLAWALYDAAIFFDADLLAASPVAFLVSLALFALVTGGGRARWAALAGAALALASWGRPNLTLAFAVLAVLAIRSRGARSSGAPPLVHPAFAAFGIALLLVPMARNLATSGEPIFLSSGGGLNVFIGNHAGANGTFRIPPESGLTNDRDLGTLSRRVASVRAGRELSSGGASRYWLGLGLDALAQDPGAALLLYARKTLLLLSSREIPNHLDLSFVAEYSSVLRFAPVRAWLLVSFGAGGLLLLWRQRGTARLVVVFVASALVSVLPFFVTARYRLPVMPALALAAGVFADALLRRLRGDRNMGRAPLVLAPIALGVSLLPLLPPPSHVPAHVNLGALHADLGENDRARAEFERALTRSPNEPRVLENLGALALRDGRYTEGVELLERALRADPRAFTAWNLRGLALAELGRWDEAMASFERSLDIFPDWAHARANAEDVWRRYQSVVRAVAADEGIAGVEGDEGARLAAALEARGYRLAAQRVREGENPLH